MIRTTVAVSGMMCSMCEAHINDAIRNHFQIKKVTSSRSKKETVILSEERLDPEEIRGVILATGYEVGEIRDETEEKHSLFHFSR